MPIATDPNRRIELILTSEQEQENPTVFMYRYLTMREKYEADRLFAMNRDGKPKEDQAYYDDILRCLAIGFVGCKRKDGSTVEFDMSAADEGLTLDEVMELITRRDLAQMPNFEDKKKLPLPQDLGPESSAPTAGASENAASPSAPPNP